MLQPISDVRAKRLSRLFLRASGLTRRVSFDGGRGLWAYRIFALKREGRYFSRQVAEEKFNPGNSVTGTALDPLANGKPVGARHTTAPPLIRDLPTALRRNSRWTVWPAPSNSV